MCMQFQGHYPINFKFDSNQQPNVKMLTNCIQSTNILFYVYLTFYTIICDTPTV